MGDKEEKKSFFRKSSADEVHRVESRGPRPSDSKSKKSGESEK